MDDQELGVACWRQGQGEKLQRTAQRNKACRSERRARNYVSKLSPPLHPLVADKWLKTWMQRGYGAPASSPRCGAVASVGNGG